MAKLKVLVAAVTVETWFKGTKEERTVQQLNLLDTDDFSPMKETFDYTPRQEEVHMIDLDALKLSVIEIGVSVFMKENGRLKASRGKIDLGTVPPKAFKSPGSTGQPAHAPAGRDNGKAVLGGMLAGSKTAPVAA